MKTLVLLFVTYLIFITSSFAQAPDTLWTKTFGEQDNDDRGNSVQQTTGGGYITTGSWGLRTLLLKTNENGDTLWTKTYGRPAAGVTAFGNSVQETTDGGYIWIGTSVGETDGLFIQKTDSLGNIICEMGIHITFTSCYGGNSVQQIIGGGYIATGFSCGGVLLIKTDESCDTLWTKTFGGDEGNSVQQTTDEGYIIVGTTSSFGAGEDDIWLIKTNENGDSIWTKTYGGITGEEGYAVQQTNDGGYIIVGYTDSYGAGEDDIWLIKTDANGDTIWTKTYGGSSNEEGFSVWQTSDSGYVITGYTNSFGAGDNDVWIIKTDANGDTLWTKTLGGVESDVGKSIQQTADGGYIVTGYTSSFGAGGEDVWLIKLDSDIVGVDDYQENIPNSYYLFQSYPNPFNPTTTIKYQIPELSFVTIKVCDVLGRDIITLVNEEKSFGSYEVEFDATGLPSGVYFYKLEGPGSIQIKKMVLLK